MNVDYSGLGLKIGIEIHQQLDTRKLFSSCPSLLADNQDADAKIKRELLAVEGESGKIDKAAAAEKKKKKQFHYLYFSASCSLVELDEEPPHPMCEQALTIALQLATLCNAHIMDAVQVMRKTVIDGSNTSGFQRTALIAQDGKIDDVRIESICLEEDSAKIVSKTPVSDTYDLSRLGIPLIEIATAPDIRTPIHAQDIAQKIGMMLRSTGKVKRGLGTIRQDLNISIGGGVRVELKGVQDLRLIPTIIDYEIERQHNMKELYAQLQTKEIIFDDTIYDLTKSLGATSSKILRQALDETGALLAIRLPGHKGYLGKQVQPDRRYGSELSDHAKTVGVQGLFHSDELPSYGITKEEVDIIKKETKCEEHDAFVLIASTKDKAKEALIAVLAKAKQLRLAKEVRMVGAAGTSAYMRPMPGAARMYPETDLPLIIPNTKHITIPELIDDKIARYVKEYNLSQDHARQFARSSYDMDTLAKNIPNVSPTFIAAMTFEYPKEIKRKENIDLSINILHEKILPQLNKGKIVQDSVKEILLEHAKTGTLDFSKYVGLCDEEIDTALRTIIKENTGAPMGALMGMAMQTLKGKVSGKVISEKLKKLV